MFGLGSEFDLSNDSWYFNRHAWYRKIINDDLTIVSISRKNTFLPRIRTKHVKDVRFINISSYFIFFSYIVSFLYILRNINVCYFQDPAIFFAHIILIRLFNKSVFRISGVHYEYRTLNLIKRLLFKIGITNSHRVRTITYSAISSLKKDFASGSNKIEFVHFSTPVDPTFLRKHNLETINSTKDSKKLTGICVARPSVSKGLVELVNLCDHIQLFDLIVVSPKILKESNFDYENLENCIKNSTRIKLFDSFLNSEELCKLYHGCDFFVSMSKSEGLGKVYIEATASGLPVFCRSNHGSEYLLKDISSIVTFESYKDSINKILSFCQNIKYHKEQANKSINLLNGKYFNNTQGVRNVFRK